MFLENDLLPRRHGWPEGEYSSGGKWEKQLDADNRGPHRKLTVWDRENQSKNN